MLKAPYRLCWSSKATMKNLNLSNKNTQFTNDWIQQVSELKRKHGSSDERHEV